MQRDRIESCAMAALALVRGCPVAGVKRTRRPLCFLAGLIGFEAFHPHTGAVAALAPSLAGIKRQQPWIRLGEAATAGRTGAASGEDLDLAPRCKRVRYALAQLEGAVNRSAQRRLLARCAQQRGDRQLDVMFHEALQAWERFGRYKLPIDPQLRRATRGRPAGELTIMTLAVRYQRRQQLDRLAAIILQQ